MEKYESKHIQIKRPVEHIYAAVSSFDNFTPILADKVEGWCAADTKCSFKAKGFNVKLHMIEREHCKHIKIVGEDGSPMDFTFWLQLVSAAPEDTRMRIVLHVELNMMMKMMVGGKLQAAVDQIADKIAESFNH